MKFATRKPSHLNKSNSQGHLKTIQALSFISQSTSERICDRRQVK